MSAWSNHMAPRPLRGSQEVVPGPCPPEGCPRPTELVCIQVDKIYDACSQRHCLENIMFFFQTPCESVQCRIVPGSFVPECELVQIQDDPPLVRATVDFLFDMVVQCDGQTEEVTVRASIIDEDTFPKNVVLFGIADEMFCKVEAVLECLGCDPINIDSIGTQVSCEVGVYLEIKTAAHVQLLVPSYGFCPVPPECEELPTRCEEFLTGPPPRRFPPQPFQEEIVIEVTDPEGTDTDGIFARSATIQGAAGSPLAEVEVWTCNLAGDASGISIDEVTEDTSYTWWRHESCRVRIRAVRGRITVYAASDGATQHLQIQSDGNEAIIESDTFRCALQGPYS